MRVIAISGEFSDYLKPYATIFVSESIKKLKDYLTSCGSPILQR